MTSAADIEDLERELDWLAELLELRLRRYFQSDEPAAELESLTPPELGASAYARLVAELELGWRARVALILALAPDLRPSLLDVFALENKSIARRFTEFGGARLGGDDGFYPTAETVAFVLGGTSLEARIFVSRLLDPSHPLARAGVLRAERRDSLTPMIKAPLRVSADTLSLLTLGRELSPTHGAEFPAQRIETGLGWDDLVIHPATRRQLDEFHTWLAHGRTLREAWNMAAKLRPGYRALFHGPPGTGKSVTACLLGKTTGREVYRVDLSMVVSKYIGETEKNLARLFDRAERRDWILFFDEADALFGKRGEAKDSHDRYANQEVAYLLQRIEGFDGVAILASNLRDNLDDAFTRRFESIVYFPMPRASEREQLWRRGFPEQAPLCARVDLGAIARGHELSGGGIINVIRHVCLESLARDNAEIETEDITRAIRRELAKYGRGL